MNNQWCRLLVGVLSLQTVSVFTYAEGSNIWLGKIEQEVSSLTISNGEIKWTQVTDKPSYHNQPYFHLQSNSLFYTGMVANEQTDFFRYDLSTGVSQNLTQSKESEYSPTVMPKQDGLSGIIVDGDGMQWLWQWTMDGQSKAKLLAAEPIGYHVWLNDKEVLAFVLGKQSEPIHTLQRFTINSSNTQGDVIDQHVGASLWAIPGTKAFSYSRMLDNKHQLMSYQVDDSRVNYLAELPSSSNYYAWAPDGFAITPAHSEEGQPSRQLVAWSGTTQWIDYLDLGDKCNAGISRLAISENYQYIAVVCNR